MIRLTHLDFDLLVLIKGKKKVIKKMMQECYNKKAGIF